MAKHFGLEIYATAGTEEKRMKLLEMGCKGVYDSHSYEWAPQLMRDTDGRGVDAVLNSLHGTHILFQLFSPPSIYIFILDFSHILN